jgi:hypothetical protein
MANPRQGRAAMVATSAVIATALSFPATSAATVTIGSNLGRAPTVQFGGTAQTETDSQISLGSGSQAPGGLTSPVNGTVVRWRIRVGDTAGAGGALRIIRPLGGNLFTGAGTSATVIPPVNATTPLDTQLPIQIGDRIGLDLISPGGMKVFVPDPDATFDSWVPALVDGSPGRPPDPPSSGYEMAFNAEIEPTSTFTIDKAKPKRGGKVVLQATVSNPGTLIAGDARDAGVAVAATAAKRKKLLKRATSTVTAPGQITLRLRPTKAAKSELRSRGRLKAKVKLAFTPTGGTAATDAAKVKLKA